MILRSRKPCWCGPRDIRTSATGRASWSRVLRVCADRRQVRAGGHKVELALVACTSIAGPSRTICAVLEALLPAEEFSLSRRNGRAISCRPRALLLLLTCLTARGNIRAWSNKLAR